MRYSISTATVVCCWEGKTLLGTVCVSPKGALVTGTTKSAQIKAGKVTEKVKNIAATIAPNKSSQKDLERILTTAIQGVRLTGHPQRKYPFTQPRQPQTTPIVSPSTVDYSVGIKRTFAKEVNKEVNKEVK